MRDYFGEEEPRTAYEETLVLSLKYAGFPTQPVVRAADGVVRFKENRIVSRFMDAASNGETLDLNGLAAERMRGKYESWEYEQFLQLIGYSLSAIPHYPDWMGRYLDAMAEDVPERARAEEESP